MRRFRPACQRLKALEVTKKVSNTVAACQPPAPKVTHPTTNAASAPDGESHRHRRAGSTTAAARNAASRRDTTKLCTCPSLSADADERFQVLGVGDAVNCHATAPPRGVDEVAVADVDASMRDRLLAGTEVEPVTRLHQ